MNKNEAEGYGYFCPSLICPWPQDLHKPELMPFEPTTCTMDMKVRSSKSKKSMDINNYDHKLKSEHKQDYRFHRLSSVLFR